MPVKKRREVSMKSDLNYQKTASKCRRSQAVGGWRRGGGHRGIDRGERISARNNAGAAISGIKQA